MKSEMHEAHRATRGERAEVKKRQDNLKMEGSMQFESTSKSAGNAIAKVNFSRSNRSRDVQSSIVIGEDTASVAKAIQKKEQVLIGSGYPVKYLALSSKMFKKIHRIILRKHFGLNVDAKNIYL
jgi:hypothetical protein